ncbi:retropepsin-like aspartic protease [Thermosulfurimonas sp. F29]|uniref:retropepsin-like aspartic protease n=1 Tax=Thermosulfurimonas sp. F29 TaxID=2867247 RepID=UPI001C835FB2|nr:retropepsin-like aspartic protease [Thermosulfurimonas sp. F29]MBX6422827.1 retropepsin-like domain-containing protein [Thermosulfurimonas sp. F29]
MGVIVKRVRLEGSKGEAEVEVLFDSGASMSFIRRGLAERLGLVEVLPRPYRFETAEAGRIIEAREAVRLDFYLNGDRLSDEFLVLPDEVATEEVVIGASTLQKWRLVLDFEKEDVYSVRKVKKHMLK